MFPSSIIAGGKNAKDNWFISVFLRVADTFGLFNHLVYNIHGSAARGFIIVYPLHCALNTYLNLSIDSKSMKLFLLLYDYTSAALLSITLIAHSAGKCLLSLIYYHIWCFWNTILLLHWYVCGRRRLRLSWVEFSAVSSYSGDAALYLSSFHELRQTAVLTFVLGHSWIWD